MAWLATIAAKTAITNVGQYSGPTDHKGINHAIHKHARVQLSYDMHEENKHLHEYILMFTNLELICRRCLPHVLGVWRGMQFDQCKQQITMGAQGRRNLSVEREKELLP